MSEKPKLNGPVTPALAQFICTYLLGFNVLFASFVSLTTLMVATAGMVLPNVSFKSNVNLVELTLDSILRSVPAATPLPVKSIISPTLYTLYAVLAIVLTPTLAVTSNLVSEVILLIK